MAFTNAHDVTDAVAKALGPPPAPITVTDSEEVRTGVYQYTIAVGDFMTIDVQGSKTAVNLEAGATTVSVGGKPAAVLAALGAVYGSDFAALLNAAVSNYVG